MKQIDQNPKSSHLLLLQRAPSTKTLNLPVFSFRKPEKNSSILGFAHVNPILMEKLHPDIKLSILLRLPVESINQCKLVCKPWRDLLRDTKVGLLFCIGLDKNWYGGKVQLYYGGQYDEIYIDDDDDDDDRHDYYSYRTLTKIDHPLIMERPFFNVMLGSCNGLVCFFVPHHDIDDPVYICNPITGEYLNLPRLTSCETHPPSSHTLASGFGYIHSTYEYKVVRIYYDHEQPSIPGRVQVYTLGGGSGWRNKGEITDFLSSSGVFINGALHWLDQARRKIVAFDLADEEFRVLPSPPCFVLPRNRFIFSFKSLGGCLCVTCTDKKTNSNSFEEVKDYHSWSWSREFSIPWEGPAKGTYYRPFALTKDNKILLLYTGIISCYDPDTVTLKKLWDDDSRGRYTQAIPHMNSHVSLKALGEKSERRR